MVATLLSFVGIIPVFVAEVPIHVVRRSDDKGKASKPMDVLLQSLALQN